MLTDEEMMKDYKLAVKTSSALGVCPACLGVGYRTHEVLECYHRGEYKDEYTPCNTCEGLGLVVTITKEVVANPIGYYRTSPKIFYLPYNAKEKATEKLTKE